MKGIEFIIYVSDQVKSRDFYSKLLNMEPSLHVPGMTEFILDKNVKLGLMPENGIAKIITPAMPHPSEASGAPRCELYLKVENPADYIERGIVAGAKLISPLQPRDWGDTAGYIADPDGHVAAFAE